jgi:hypothetical protein
MGPHIHQGHNIPDETFIIEKVIAKNYPAHFVMIPFTTTCPIRGKRTCPQSFQWGKQGLGRHVRVEHQDSKVMFPDAFCQQLDSGAYFWWGLSKGT